MWLQLLGDKPATGWQVSSTVPLHPGRDRHLSSLELTLIPYTDLPPCLPCSANTITHPSVPHTIAKPEGLL